MADIETLKKAMPIAPLKLIVLEGCKNLGENVNRHLVSYRKKDNIEQDVGINLKGYQEDNFIVDASLPKIWQRRRQRYYPRINPRKRPLYIS